MSVDAWIEVAKGPLFAVTFLVMILGLGRHALLQVYLLVVKKGWRLKQVSWGSVARETLSWAVPARHIEPGTRLFSLASYVMHVGILIAPVFLIDHVALWEGFLGVSLPSIGKGTADTLTLLTIACGLLLLALRTFKARHRLVSRKSDYLLLMLVLVPFLTGYCASHPSVDPLPWIVMMLTHLLSAELLFVLTPFTKLAHVVLFFFDRISAVYWQLRPGAGDRVAEALYGKKVGIG
jgi:nitrate reductase gamma subunit